MRPNPLEWVFFDFDGTLADTERLGIELDQEAYRAFGITPTDEEMRSLAGTTGEESIPAVFAAHGMRVSAEEFAARRQSCRVIYYDLPLEASPGAPELIARLRGQGVRLAVVSTTIRPWVQRALARVGLAGSFEFMVCGDDVSRHKPDPEPYLEALRRAGTQPERALAVEDSKSGVASAKAAGIYTIGYRGGSVAQDVSRADEIIVSFVGLRL